MSDEWTPDEVIRFDAVGAYGPLTVEVGRDDDGGMLVVETETVQYALGADLDEALKNL